MLSEEQIRTALTKVIDPEIGFNIVDMGLVYKIDIHENNIIITMTLTTPGCPMHNSITDWAEKEIKNLDPLLDVKINLVWQPPWTPNMMNSNLRKSLGY
ncbi:MAG: metal-sulfur cluster assembly factor [Ignavibacteriales bacterium]|jgi:metal-sulfur cluster biosynthetic enzyme|nr:metal-sulfur cluster assembly factor [Ignavibacteriales bacterium]MBK7981855.1 metal-sulfur cluster assembly factor [Ignavibacteriota bacterium]